MDRRPVRSARCRTRAHPAGATAQTGLSGTGRSASGWTEGRASGSPAPSSAPIHKNPSHGQADRATYQSTRSGHIAVPGHHEVDEGEIERTPRTIASRSFARSSRISSLASGVTRIAKRQRGRELLDGEECAESREHRPAPDGQDPVDAEDSWSRPRRRHSPSAGRRIERTTTSSDRASADRSTRRTTLRAMYPASLSQSATTGGRTSFQSKTQWKVSATGMKATRMAGAADVEARQRRLPTAGTSVRL